MAEKTTKPSKTVKKPATKAKATKTSAVKTTKKVEKAPAKTGKYYYANGKRKTSIARVRLYENGNGEININEKDITDFCKVYIHKEVISSPLKIVGHQKTFDIIVKVIGGGQTSQVEATRHGIAKALVEFDMELRPTLKKAGLLTRDSRIKERKKYGLKRARRAPQWAKR